MARGTHRSLLLVDRRNRQSPVAYHYDSYEGGNDRQAAMLATRLGANLQQASIRQQENKFDCGVFVVDGTRALIERLVKTDGQHIADLNDLVPDRRDLQGRLRNFPGRG
ncbi:hypothetical protein [Mesorhizobium sp. L-2-11]|uniref:hypothetical protein n=1 Tax=Mesorhizobium sp. L-2-11 TaxID=2744521 RepID=UPI0019282788|nr:hypothetical protein [Mesorhizobium sp. L-2-11]BCH18978.1 hypothetical protein MesoLjLa_58290 [Mesorhizobium sp. L-2-11]